jgi:hypothetical protein
MNESVRIVIYKDDGEMLMDRLVPTSIRNKVIDVEIRFLQTGMYRLETELNGQKILEQFFIDNN